MDIKGLLSDEFNELYFGPGLDNGMSLDEFRELIREEITHWVDTTREEFKDDPLFKDVI